MKPTKSHGICGRCREPNSYSRTHCVRCEARLAWAFLIDGKDDKEPETPFINFFLRLLGQDEYLTAHKIQCRFCEHSIYSNAKICPHCGNWQATAEVTRLAWALVDPDAPEIKRLLHSRNKGDFSATLKAEE